MSATFRSFAARNYRLWFAGFLVSNVGTWMQRIAQDWLVLTELTNDDAGAVGVSLALQFGPPLLLLPITGMVVDRVDRRKLVVVTQASQGLLAATLAVLTLAGLTQLWMVFVLATLLGVVTAFDVPARQVFVGYLVPAEHLSNAVALNSTSFNSARLVGPGLAGFLVALFGPGWVFAINAGTVGVMLLAIALLRSSEFVPSLPGAGRRGGFRDGLRYIRRRPDVLLVLVMVGLVGMLAFNFQVLVATMARIEFRQGADVFGILSSVIAVGSVAGALLAARRERPRLRTITLACVGFGIGLALSALAPNVWWYGAALVVVGFSALTMVTTANAYVQTQTHPALRGRVIAVYLAVFVGGTPIGAPLVGWVVNAYGPRWGIAVATVGCILAVAVAAVWYVRRREMRLRWVTGRRWPIRIRTGRTETDRQLATTEIAIVEAESSKT